MVYDFCTTTQLLIFEKTSEYRTYRDLTVVCDACCRVPEGLQHLPRYAVRGKCTCAFLLVDGNSNILQQYSKYLGALTIAEAEYRAIICALDNAAGYCRGEISVWVDNEVIVNQLAGFSVLRSPRIRALFDTIKILELRFTQVQYFHHSRGSFWARAADKLATEEYSRKHSG